MWRPNRTTVFKDGSNVSDIMLSEAGLCFERKKHFNISLDLIIALRTASDISASNFKWWSLVNNDTQISDRFDCWENGIIYLVGLPLEETAQSVTTNSTCKTFLNSYGQLSSNAPVI